MDEKNSYLTALGWVSLTTAVIAAVFWMVGLSEQQNAGGPFSDGLEGLGQLAIAGSLFQLAVLAGLLWMVGRAIVAQLAKKPAEKPAPVATAEPAGETA